MDSLTCAGPFRFDRVIDRKGTASLKYDCAEARRMPAGVLPMWVADMDFQTAPPVLEALGRLNRHGIFGYAECEEGYFTALRGWFADSYGWKIEREWLVKTPGVVFALFAAVRAFTREGDGVLIQRPVYGPFTQAVVQNGRRVVNSPLMAENGRYFMDFADLEQKITENAVKLMILCSPHNPVGRVWTREELSELGDICLRHGVTVVSDEIHADLTYPGVCHTVFASLSPALRECTVTCTAPSKTFNIAGLQVSNIFIANERLRRKFEEEIRKTGYSQLNLAGLVACRAAYGEGRGWFEEMKRYLAENLSFARDFLAENLPRVRLTEPEGTYLLWLDFNGLGLGREELENLIVRRAGLWLDGGEMFGPEGAGFQRMNIACPRATLREAFDRLKTAVESLEHNRP